MLMLKVMMALAVLGIVGIIIYLCHCLGINIPLPRYQRKTPHTKKRLENTPPKVDKPSCHNDQFRRVADLAANDAGRPSTMVSPPTRKASDLYHFERPYGCKFPNREQIKSNYDELERKGKLAAEERARQALDSSFSGKRQAVVKDETEDIPWGAFDGYPVKAALRIGYVDGEGNKTFRNIDVREVDNYLSGGMIYAFCKLRNAIRTFRIDRIQECVDMETGEIIEDVKQYLLDKYQNTIEYIAGAFAEKHADLIRCLIYVSKADGQMRREEREIIYKICRKLCKDERLSPDIVTDIINCMDIPSLHGFKLAVGRVATSGHPDVIMSLLDASKNIVATQKNIHPAEQVAIDYIHKKYMKLGIIAT
jgi:tellurite resistance protein